MSIDDILKENTFSEPRLVLFLTEDLDTISQAFVVAEKTIIFEISGEVNVKQAICSLIAAYYVFYVNYPKSVPAYCLLMFVQEHLMGSFDSTTKKPARYTAFVNALLQ